MNDSQLPSDEIRQRYDKICQILDVRNSLKNKAFGKSLINYDALEAINFVVKKSEDWADLTDKTLFKRKLKKSNVTI